MSDSRSCFDCLYRDIRETSYEWIDCFCHRQGNKQMSIQYGCPIYQEEPSRQEKIHFICNLLKNTDWEPKWPISPENKLAHQILFDTTKYLIENEIDIRKKD